MKTRVFIINDIKETFKLTHTKLSNILQIPTSTVSVYLKYGIQEQKITQRLRLIHKLTMEFRSFLPLYTCSEIPHSIYGNNPTLYSILCDKMLPLDKIEEKVRKIQDEIRQIHSI